MKQAIAFVLYVILTGCATTGGNSNAISIPDAATPRHFVVLKQLPAGQELNRDSIVRQLMNSIGATNIERDTVVKNINTQLIKSRVLYGPTFNKQTSSIDVSWRWSLALNHNFLSASFPIQIVDNGKNYNVTLGCPTSLMSDVKDLSLTGIPKWNYEQIGRNLTNACNSATISIQKTAEFHGEFDSKYNDTSVFANFKRKLTTASDDVWRSYKTGAESTALDIEKSVKFVIPTKNGNSNLVSISVFPYRNGAKVVYAYGYSYRVNGDGSTSYSQADVDSIKKTIEKIAND